MSMKNSNDTVGNRTRDLLHCSAVPQTTALGCATEHYCRLVLTVATKFLYARSHFLLPGQCISFIELCFVTGCPNFAFSCSLSLLTRMLVTLIDARDCETSLKTCAEKQSKNFALSALVFLVYLILF
jgi:hypothetical protein